MNIFTITRKGTYKLRLVLIFLATLLLLIIFSVSSFNIVQAQFTGSIVSCGRSVDDFNTVGIDESDPCGYCELLTTGQNVVNFIVYFAVFVAILMFVYAGFLYVTSGANEGNIGTAHRIFWSVLIGLFITLASWLIIDTIMKTFYVGSAGNPDFGPWNQIKCAQTPVVPGIN